MQRLDVRAGELILNMPCRQSPGFNVTKQNFVEGLRLSLDFKQDALWCHLLVLSFFHPCLSHLSARDSVAHCGVFPKL